MNFKFTNNWFNLTAGGNFEKYFKGKSGNFLEIGTYEGKAALWLMTYTKVKITVIDTFEGGEEHLDESDLYERFTKNIEPYQERITVLKGKSQIVLKELKDTFDFIYIDGSHYASDVLEDAVLSFRFLKKGGLIIFDDYAWDLYDNPTHNPRLGIDAFLSAFKEQLKVLHTDYQVVIEKL